MSLMHSSMSLMFVACIAHDHLSRVTITWRGRVASVLVDCLIVDRVGAVRGVGCRQSRFRARPQCLCHLWALCPMLGVQNETNLSEVTVKIIVFTELLVNL